MIKTTTKEYSTIKLTLIKFSIVLLFTILISFESNATIYNVGPNETLTSLDQVPWLSLQAGDEVNIYYKNTPYRTKIGLRSRGTSQNPIIIRGIVGPNGELPVLSGENATTPTNLNGFFSEQWDEFLGVIIIKRGPSDSYGYKPGHITIENLKITGGADRYSYTNSNGNVIQYARSAAAVWAVLVENLTVRNCEITDNGNGLFVLSKGDASTTGELVSSNILIEHNRIYYNGAIGSDRQHGVYTQAAGMIYQYNEFGHMLPGTGGSTLKDRSSGCVIRYNEMQSGARNLDLIEPEDSYGYITQQPNFHDTYVYGNIFINDKKDVNHVSASSIVHYGGDSGVLQIYRKGTLHFYNNTVVITSDTSESWRVRLFDLSTNDETVELKNNIFYLSGNSNFFMMRDFGIANVKENNWINSGWQHGGSTGSFGGTINVLTNGLTEGNGPLFVDFTNENFHLDSNSPCIDLGADLSGDGVLLDKMYMPIANFETRTVIGNGIDLGAYESDVTASVLNNTVNNTIDIYPNPTSTGIIKITATEPAINVLTTDINGKKVNTHYENEIINISHLSSGVYFLKITTKNKVTNKKIIKK